MVVRFDVKPIKEIYNMSKSLSRQIVDLLNENADIACKEAENVVKSKTPNSNDGKIRGFNVISNSLQNSWSVKYAPLNGTKTFGNVIFENSKPYAKYVQDGHRVSRHFVPWLYKDGMGTLSYETNHSQPLFGLVVGTKTKYVKGVDMVNPAIDAFNKKFNELNKRLFNNLK